MERAGEIWLFPAIKEKHCTMRLPLIIKKQLDHSLRDLKQNIEASNIPEAYRDGLYKDALEMLNQWEAGDLSTEEIYKSKNNPVIIAGKLIWKDKDILSIKEKDFPDNPELPNR